MIGPKLDVRCQMPDVDAVCSAGQSIKLSQSIISLKTLICLQGSLNHHFTHQVDDLPIADVGAALRVPLLQQVGNFGHFETY